MLVILAWLMLSLHVIFCDSAGNFDSSNPCGKENPVANICQFSEIANTSKAFVYILNSPAQNKRTCTCSLSPISSNVRIKLRYRQHTRSTENINLKINDFTFDKNHINTTTDLTERKELVLNTNPVNKSEEVCLLITAVEEDRRFNISCDNPTSDATDSDTNIVVANICQFSEIANTSKAFVKIVNSREQNKRTCTCSLSPTSPNVTIHFRYRELTRSTENINLKINDFVFDTNHTNTNAVLSERNELVLNTNPVFNKSEEVCLLITADNEDRRFNISCDYPTSAGTDSDTNIVGNFDSNNRCGNTTSVANICQFSEVANTSKAFVYILNSPEQNKRTCTCSLSPISSNVMILLRYREYTHSTENINLKINDIVFDTNHTVTATVLSERNELVLHTNPVNKSEEVCLLITAEEDRRFNISCDNPTSDATDSDTNIVGVVIGCAIVGVIVIVMVVLNIVILKRKANKKRKIKKTPKLSQEENGAATRNAEDDNDYYMTENPMYNMFEPTMDKNEIPEYALVHKHEPKVDKNEIPEYALVHKHAPNDEQQNMEDYDDNPKPGIYDCIQDSPNDVSQPLVSEQTDENNVHK